MVVDQVLIGLAFLGAAEEQAAVGPEVVVHLDDDLEVAVLLVGDDDAAVAGHVLAADDGAVLDDPVAAGLVVAGAAVAGLGADVPAVERASVEDRGESGVVKFVTFGFEVGGEGMRGLDCQC